ncbi:hypothetical protein VA596_41695 [Amycolatopsis sp., V23-08]|uniref:Uncharacterized protein n=1 Tax=Amycolatopsis heterodermiae TaxID=3110235 RepID=A0ABU5RIK3_9PSEU|nr:hypothetical protein [Amycolatopsis sp., V23-08]MEA5366101.1 hypothetical protein [Amycolatopsis sp., V23-08]
MSDTTMDQLITDVFSRVTSHANGLGVFERVTGHEPKNAPGSGLSASFWLKSFRPHPKASGLNVTAAVLTLNVRIGQNMLKEPQDDVEIEILTSSLKLMAAYSGDFDLGGAIRNVDLLGETGAPLALDGGYINADGVLLRVGIITLPLIINDVFPQEA